jgi:hypothetical protein
MKLIDTLKRRFLGVAEVVDHLPSKHGTLSLNAHIDLSPKNDF